MLTGCTDADGCDLSGIEANVLASCLKKFLRELPDPLIPSQWYDSFIEASSKSKSKLSDLHLRVHPLISKIVGTRADDQCAALLYQLVQQLPEHHRSTLSYLLAHICRLCQLQHGRGKTEPPTPVIQVFAHIFLRPPWERIM